LRSDGLFAEDSGVNVPGVEYMASINGDPKPGKILWLPAGDTEEEARGGRNPNPNAAFIAVTKNGQLLPEVKQSLSVIAKKQFHACVRPRSCGGRAARVPRGESSGCAAADRDARGGPDGQDDAGSDEGSRETRRVGRVQLQKHARGTTVQT
jgi:hypothetical protein